MAANSHSVLLEETLTHSHIGMEKCCVEFCANKNNMLQPLHISEWLRLNRIQYVNQNETFLSIDEQTAISTEHTHSSSFASLARHIYGVQDTNIYYHPYTIPYTLYSYQPFPPTYWHSFSFVPHPPSSCRVCISFGTYFEKDKIIF